MSQPPWGSPEPQITSSTIGQVADGSDGSGFVILVEQTIGSGEMRAWSVEPDPTPLPPHTTREAARAIALETARTLRPQHPWNQNQRRVLRLDPDTYVVLVTGTTRLFHFRVTVTELLPDDA